MHRGQDMKNLGGMREVIHSGTCENYYSTQLQGVVRDEPGHVSRGQIPKSFSSHAKEFDRIL